MEVLITTREKILNSATLLFEERGYAGTTTAAIAGKAGVAEITLFRHFKGKEPLFRAVMEEIRKSAGMGDFSSDFSGDPKRDIPLFAGRLFRYFMRENRTIRMMLFESISNPELRDLLRDGPMEGISGLHRYFASIGSADHLKVNDPELLAETLVSLVFGYAIAITAQQQAPDVSAAEHRLMTIIDATFIPSITAIQNGSGKELF
jgi:AcrR family transcriptional regulator